MNLQTFFDNFELLAEAPNGVQKLRELILQLAVMGKLAPQDPSDEPASRLLEKIKAEKEVLFKEGKIRKIENLNLIDVSQVPFEIPDSWEWARFPELGEFGRGKSKHRPRNDPSLFLEGTYPMVQTGDVARANYIIYTYTGLYNKKGLAQSRLWPKGTLCITIAANIADAALLGFDACFPDSVVGFIPSEQIGQAEYFAYFMRTAKEHLQDYAPSTAQKNINLEILGKLLIPLPPLAEQHRIVTKVDQLMKLCDELEARQQKKREARVTINNTAIAQLLTAREPEEFNKSWQRIYNNFDLLYSTPENIGKLRSCILQLAVMGKLAPQDTSDEPAFVLLEKIKAEKELLVKEGKIKKEKLLTIEEDNIPFEVPKHWKWVRFGEIILYIESGWSPMCEKRPKEGNEWGVLKVSAVTWDNFNPDENKALPVGLEPRPEHEVKVGDFLMSRANTSELIAKSVIVETTPKYLLLSDKLLRVLFSDYIDKRFFNLYNNSRVARDYYAKKASGTSTSMRNISREQIHNMPVPLPPLDGQRRIVAKVNQLMTLCDQVEAQLKQCVAKSEKLMETAVRQLLNVNTVAADICVEPTTLETKTVKQSSKKTQSHGEEAVQLNLPLF